MHDCSGTLAACSLELFDSRLEVRAALLCRRISERTIGMETDREVETRRSDRVAAERFNNMVNPLVGVVVQRQETCPTTVLILLIREDDNLVRVYIRFLLWLKVQLNSFEYNIKV